MNFRCLLLGVCLLCCRLAFAQEKPGDAPTPSAVAGMEEPDFLEPVYHNIDQLGRLYLGQLCERLSLDRPYILQMLVKPSFSPEYVVRLWEDFKNDPFAAPFATKKNGADRLLLSYAIADKNIWQSLPGMISKEQQKVTVSTKTVEFPEALAARLDALWKRMLLRTHYSEWGTGGLDGTTYEFTRLSMQGKVWLPQQRKSPALFVDLGESLIACCKSSDAGRAAAQKVIEEKAALLEKYLDGHPSALK